MIDTATREEMKKVIRCFSKYDSETRANMGSSHRLGYRQKQATGSFFYVHPSVPGVAFETRSRAARAALNSAP